MSDGTAGDADGEEEVVTAPLYVWIGLSVIACISFWFQATVTEDKFVPALNTIANYFSIPDDIAGATLMAAGASSPELFSSFVALFITHTSLGLGTIVGSEIFNQLIICAGAVFSAKTVGLKLDATIVTREVGFYALSIVLLYFALQDNRPDPDDDSGEDHIYIGFGQACMVFSGYIAYVFVCAKMDDIVAFCSTGKGPRDSQQDLRTNEYGDNYGAVGSPSVRRVAIPHVDNQKMVFLREKSMTREPIANFEQVELYRTRTGESDPNDPDGQETTANQSIRSGYRVQNSKLMSSVRSNVSDVSRSWQPRTARSSQATEYGMRQTSGVSESSAGTAKYSRYSDGQTLRKIEFLMHKSKPTDEHGMYDIEMNAHECRLSCFMWQRSYFYNKARLATHGWHLRWFSFYPEKITSVPNRLNADKHRMTYPITDFIEVDEQRLIIRIINPKKRKRNYYLMAPSKEILDVVVKKYEDILELHSVSKEEGKDDALEGGGSADEFAGEDHTSLVEYPEGASLVSQFFFVLLFPFRFLLHWTVPDVQVFDSEGNPISTLSTAFIAVGMCLLWLVVGSYAMVSSLEKLADLMDVPPAVVGVTVSAAGTSLPNYVASRIAAEKGFGNMAVSNAFGSNTFNIMVGLGLPWVLYTSFGTGFQPYHGLKDEGILESVEILCSVLAVFVVVVLTSGFVLYRWHAIIFILLYIAYIAFEIARVYV